MALESDAAKNQARQSLPGYTRGIRSGVGAYGGMHAGTAGPRVDLPAADAAGLAEHIAYLTMTRSFERVFREVARATLTLPQPQPQPQTPSLTLKTRSMLPPMSLGTRRFIPSGRR